MKSNNADENEHVRPKEMERHKINTALTPKDYQASISNSPVKPKSPKTQNLTSKSHTNPARKSVSVI